MSKSLDLFVNALDAIDNENFNEAIEALNTIIGRYPAPVGEKNKPTLIRLLKHRCQAYFALGNYNDTLTDLQRLKDLGCNVNDDETLNALSLTSAKRTAVYSTTSKKQKT